jgi:hypothetical protein
MKVRGKLAKMLSAYGIHPKVMRVNTSEGEKRSRGYSRDQFVEVWKRYVPKQLELKEQELRLE